MAMADQDPTSLNNVLIALKQSEKLKHWDKPPREFGPDNPEDSDYNRNGLKDVGDFSSVTVSPGFCFGESQVSEEESKPITPESEVTCDTEFRIDPGEELQNECQWGSLEVAKRAREQYQLMMQLEEMSLEDEIKQRLQEKVSARYRTYLNKLEEIQRVFETKLHQYYHQRDEKLEREEYRLRQQKEEAIKAVKKCESDYSHYISERSSWLLEVMEDARRKEAEQADIRRALVNDLLNAKETFVVKLAQMQQLLEEFEGSEVLDSNTESILNQTVSHVECLLNNANQSSATQKQLNEAQSSLQVGLGCINTITQTLNSKKEERAKLEAERINQEAEETKLKAAAQLEMEKQEAARREEERLAEEQRQEGGYDLVAMISGRRRLEDLKNKLGNFLTAGDIMTEKYPNMKMEVQKALSVINQLTATDQRINKEKLQKLTSYLSGREFRASKGTIENETVVITYAKNLAVSNLIKCGTDKQVSGIAAYSWLMVNLVSCFPELWDLFLYHLFISCPYLLPMKPLPLVGQSEEDFCKSIGMKGNEKSDAHIGRMGTSASMYGLVLAMIIKRKNIPINAPVIGWELLAKHLSLTPTSGVSAVIFVELLKSLGFSLQETYGKQFLKLMDYLINVYMHKIEEVTEGAGAQGLSVLQTFLETFNRTRKIQQHELVDKFY
ncbi:mRNA export factor GLE1 [Procambarus clarkii]|uniref:mRNA export factor GLE1 n=1 Tax=Procambarus clarkii TaxID=6728 RepID=UPI003742F07A